MGALLTQFMNKYAYTDFHELNADWMIKTLMEMINQVENFVSLNAIKYADPIQWNITSQYEKNTVVIDPLTGTAYISVKPVPMGVVLTNTDYWTVVFDLGSFVVRAAKNFSNRYEADTTLTATFSSSNGDWLVWGDTLYEVIVPTINAGDQYVIDSNIRHITMEEVADALAQAIQNVQQNVDNLDAKVGDLDDLTSPDKTSIVNAINSVLTDIGTSISAISLKLNNLKIYNVKDYGAVGDGVTDDTQSIIDCITANGGAYFPEGTYIISSTIYLDTDGYIVGDDTGLSIIKAAAGSNIDMIKSVGFDSLKGTDDHDNAQHNITIANITIDGNYRENPEINTSIGTVLNTSGTGVSIYAGGINMYNVNIVNCADDGLYTEWASYLNTIIMVTGGESVFENLVIKCCGLHGWEFMGPHDSIISDCVIGTNNKKNTGCHNFYTNKGNFKMSNCHMYSDYGLPKVASSMYIDSGTSPIVVVNSDIEGGLDNDLTLVSSKNIFVNCRFYASFGYDDIYIANNVSKYNAFISCFLGGQVTESGLTSPTWKGGIEFNSAESADSIFDVIVDDTPACVYASVPLHCIWRIVGYNTTRAIDGRYDAIPNPEFYAAWKEENIEIRGSFDTESYFDYHVLSITPEYSMKFDIGAGIFKYYENGVWKIANGYVIYDYNDGHFKYYNSGALVIPYGTTYFDGTSLKYWDNSSWVDVPKQYANYDVRYDLGNSRYEYYLNGSWIAI